VETVIRLVPEVDVLLIEMVVVPLVEIAPPVLVKVEDIWE